MALAPRSMHFFDPGNARMVGRLADLQADALVANLEDGIAPARKADTRQHLRQLPALAAPFFVRINALESVWAWDDVTEAVSALGDRLYGILLPKVRRPAEVQLLGEILGQLETRHGLTRRVRLGLIVETPQAVLELPHVAAASERVELLCLGTADLAAERGMADVPLDATHPIWHSTLIRMVDTARSRAIAPLSSPHMDVTDADGCRSAFRRARQFGCAGALTLHPDQIALANEAFSPSKDEIAHARRVVDAIGEGGGAIVNGQFCDEATVRSARDILAAATPVGGRTWAQTQS